MNLSPAFLHRSRGRTRVWASWPTPRSRLTCSTLSLNMNPNQAQVRKRLQVSTASIQRNPAPESGGYSRTLNRIGRAASHKQVHADVQTSQKTTPETLVRKPTMNSTTANGTSLKEKLSTSYRERSTKPLCLGFGVSGLEHHHNPETCKPK